MHKWIKLFNYDNPYQALLNFRTSTLFVYIEILVRKLEEAWFIVRVMFRFIGDLYLWNLDFYYNNDD